MQWFRKTIQEGTAAYPIAFTTTLFGINVGCHWLNRFAGVDITSCNLTHCHLAAYGANETGSHAMETALFCIAIGV